MKAQRTDQVTVDIESDDIGVGSMVSAFKVSPEGILRNETGAQRRLITELENGVALGVAPGEPTRNTR